ncbi:DnaJ domain-containing protein [Myxococcota bacterium]|nr:DnaJ domain-containing protein [Myxococcota bacterium]
MAWYPVSQVPPPLLLIHLLDSRFEGFLRVPDAQGELTVYFRQGLPVRSECKNPALAAGALGEHLLELFSSGVEQFQIEPMSIPVGEGLNPLPWIRRGLRERYDLARLENETRELSRCRIAVSPRLDAAVDHFELTPPELEILRQLKAAPSTITQLRGTSQLSFKDILSLLYSLASCRLLQSVPLEAAEATPVGAQPEPQPTASSVPSSPEPEIIAELHQLTASLQDENPFVRLGLPLTATMEDIDARFRELARKFHPDTLARKDLSEFLAEAQDVFAKLTEAYNLLKEDTSREKYRKPAESKEDLAEVRRVLEAEVLYQKGIIHFRRKEYGLAEQMFLEARHKNEDGSHLAMWAWLRYLNPDNDRKAVREEVKIALQKAIQLTPREADFYFYLGKVCLDMEQIASARQYFNKAVEINSEHIEAARELRMLERRAKHAANPIAHATGSFLNLFKKKD